MDLEQQLDMTYKHKGYIFVPYVAVPFPNWQYSFAVVSTLFKTGADAIEIGLPFTDPVADGVVLQKVFRYMLRSHSFNWADVFKFLEKVHHNFPDKSILLMGYTNLFWQYGMSKILLQLKSLGVKGVVIPDMPFEEKIKYKELPLIHFITPVTSESRIKEIVLHAQGFLYLVSFKGVTGMSKQSNDIKVLSRVTQLVRKNSNIHILVGFGIDSKKKVKSVLKIANGFIVGSMLHKIILNHLESELPNNLDEALLEIERTISSEILV